MKIKKIFIIIILLFIVYCLLFPVFDAPAQGAGYEIEVSLPKGAAKGTEVSLTEYIRYLYLAGLGLIGLAALVALIIGGLIYMLSDTVFKKDQAKGMIQGAIFGLVLALSAYLILKTINPDLVNW